MSVEQPVVEGYFDSAAAYWRDVYRDEGLQGLIYRERMTAALRWASELDLPPGACALDVGCGAGLLALALARAQLTVTATDSSPEMVKLARRHADQAEARNRFDVTLADAHRLPFANGSFDLVLALGLLPWLDDPAAVIAEMARVLRPAGRMIVSADNRLRLNFLIEPRENPVLVPLKLARRGVRRIRGTSPHGAQSHLHLPAQVDGFVEAAGLRVLRRTTVGFGPFTFLGRPVLDDRRGLRLYSQLAALSDRRAAWLRRTGWHYLLLASEPDP